jgi:gluconolactonase
VEGFIGADEVRVFVEALTGAVRLDHPEGVAVHGDGSIWCGGEQGQVYRIEPDGKGFEQVASTGGFCLGLAFDSASNLFICDMQHRAVMRLDGSSLQVEVFADGVPGHPFRIPNYPVFDSAGSLYVSDSWDMKEPGPGIARLDQDGGGEMWYDKPLHFANGLALSKDGRRLYVAETFGQRISSITINSDGSASDSRTYAELPGCYPDGLAVDESDNLWIGCYEPSQILRVRGGTTELAFRDETAHLLAHPTNIVFTGTSLIAANLGRWHLTILEARVRGLPLPPALVLA